MGSSELFFVSDYQRVVPSKFAKELNAMYLNGDKEVVAQKNRATKSAKARNDRWRYRKWHNIRKFWY